MAEEVSSQMNSLSISETNPSSSATISLVSGDDIVFKVEPTIAKEMETVQSFIDETDGKITTIPLPNISSHDLPYVIEYCEKSIAGKITKEFEAEFVKKLNNEEVKELFLAANYLNIKKLLDFLSQVIADRIANKSVEYVRRYFGIENDFTPEEEAKLREELAWTFTGVDPDDEDEN
ncbi:SKP1-like protein 14 [Lathyrus oleraceus]|uniref:SKP1-like protein n=1 Tax=Pisum sativum TaxID=3888 RepID=A0A9D4YKF5_PEA|nr:SKP1-like protein 14 [Pisum sativum]KAI5440744.1 hypothetical protein KIW84_010279 [Pisum sativum]